MGLQWPVDLFCLPPLSSADDEGAANQNAAINLAITTMWALSGRQYGLVDQIVRPCIQTMPWWSRRSSYGYSSDYAAVTSYLLSWEGDRWVNWWCGCGSMCRLSGPGAVHLPGPAREVIAVTIGDTILDADQYTLEGDMLYRVRGAADVAHGPESRGHHWPRQDLSRPMGHHNTWSVEYLCGNPVPPELAHLTGVLAKEFLAACQGDKCRLPRNVTNVNRAGVSYQIDTTRILEAGKTGIAEIDLWLAAVNPAKLQCAPSVI